MHPKKEKTLVIVKPDGVQRSLIGVIIKRYEQVGLKLVGLKFMVPAAKMVAGHYTLDPDWKRAVGQRSIEGYKKKGITPLSEDPVEFGEYILGVLTRYFTSGPIVLMVWQGAHAVDIVRKITGGTEPLSSDMGTIRGDYVLDSYQMADGDKRAIRNLIHASGSLEEAKKEIAHWFHKDELIHYRLVQEQILYDVNLDGILE